jgi:hypothetical protein
MSLYTCLDEGSTDLTPERADHCHRCKGERFAEQVAGVKAGKLDVEGTLVQRQLNIQHEYAHLGSTHDCSPCLGIVRSHHCASQKLRLRGLDTPP